MIAWFCCSRRKVFLENSFLYRGYVDNVNYGCKAPEWFILQFFLYVWAYITSLAHWMFLAGQFFCLNKMQLRYCEVLFTEIILHKKTPWSEVVQLRLCLLLLSFLTNAGTAVSPHVPTLNRDLFKIGLENQNFLCCF